MYQKDKLHPVSSLEITNTEHVIIFHKLQLHLRDYLYTNHIVVNSLYKSPIESLAIKNPIGASVIAIHESAL